MLLSIAMHWSPKICTLKTPFSGLGAQSCPKEQFFALSSVLSQGGGGCLFGFCALLKYFIFILVQLHLTPLQETIHLKDVNLETGFMLGSITDYRSIILLLIIGQSISDSTDCNLQAIISQLYNVHW